MPSPLPVLLLSFIFLLNKDRSRASGIISPPPFFFFGGSKIDFYNKRKWSTTVRRERPDTTGQDYKLSRKIKEATKGGLTPFHSEVTLLCLAFWVSSWATLL